MSPQGSSETSTSTSTLAVGVVVAETYEITGLLGKGGMGAVWAARHLRLPGKRVAIKVLLGGTDDAQALARFRREAEVASRIGHAGIVEVLDFNQLPDGTPFQVLEYLAGESLGARIGRGPLPLDAALDVARQMGSALAAAHRAGVIHRDLKPENIFLCPTDAGGVVADRVKVLDFGISKIRGSQTVKTQDQVLIGTPQYMAPEQASGQNASIDARTDQFALGAIVYEMLAGRPAFSGESVVAVIMNVVTGTPTPLSTLAPGTPPVVIAAIERALAKKPDERFGDVGEFVEALTGRPLQTLGGEGDATSRPGARAPLSQEELMAATLAPAPAGASAPTVVALAALSSGAPTGAAPIALTTPPGVVKRGASLAFWTIGAVVVLGAVVVGLGMRGSVTTPSAPPPAAPAVVAPPPPVAVAPPPAPAEPAPTPTAPVKPAHVTAHAHGDGALTADVRADLDAGETALAHGDALLAKRLAQHSLLGQRSAHAFSILTRAACHDGDLTNARAGLRNVAAGDRSAVLKACAAAGLDLR